MYNRKQEPETRNQRTEIRCQTRKPDERDQRPENGHLVVGVRSVATVLYSAAMKIPAKLERRLSRLVLGVMMLGAMFVAEKALDRLAKGNSSDDRSERPAAGTGESYGAEIQHLHQRSAAPSQSTSSR